MKRSTFLLTGLVAAGITFGSLFAFSGTKTWPKHRHYHGCCAQSCEKGNVNKGAEKTPEKSKN